MLLSGFVVRVMLSSFLKVFPGDIAIFEFDNQVTFNDAHKNCSNVWKKNITLVVEFIAWGMGSGASFKQIGIFVKLIFELACPFFSYALSPSPHTQRWCIFLNYTDCFLMD